MHAPEKVVFGVGSEARRLGGGSGDAILRLCGSVVEHLSCKQKVPSSILGGGMCFALFHTNTYLLLRSN